MRDLLEEWSRSAPALLVLVLLTAPLVRLPAASVGDLLATLDPAPHIPARDLQAGLMGRPIHVVLGTRTPRMAALQALAHGSGTRFLAATPGWLGATPPAGGTPIARIHPSAIRERGHVAAIRQFLAPWWSPACGLDHDSESGAWSAVLPPEGHDRLVALLSQLDQPRIVLPPLLVAPTTPHPEAPADAPDWHTLADRLGIAIAARSPLPPLPTVQRVRDLIPALIAGGRPAAWHHGALCVDDPADHQAPAESTVMACLPLPPRIAAAALVPPWTTPGWGVLVRDRFLIAVATPTALHALLQRGLDAERSP